MTIEEAWATGLFEGEGSITFPNGKSVNAIRLRLSTTDFDVIQRLQALWGGKVYPQKRYAKHHKPAWEWNLNRQADVKRVILVMLPLLQTRRAYVAQNALDELDEVRV